MRLLRGVLLVLLVCLSLSVAARADVEPAFVGPEAVYAREIFEVVLWIDQPGVTKITGLIVADQEHLDLQAILSADPGMWKTDSDTVGHVFEYLGPADTRKQPVIRVRLRVRSVEEGTKIWVAMKNVVLWVGDTPVEIGDIYWEQKVAHVVSDDNYLTSLRLSDCALSPAFSPYRQNYTATVSHEVGQVSVEAQTSNSAAVIQVDSPMLEQGKTTDVTVTVTAEDGSSICLALTTLCLWKEASSGSQISTGPHTAWTSAPRSHAATAMDAPIEPVEALVQKRTSSHVSRVGPRVSMTVCPSMSCGVRALSAAR